MENQPKPQNIIQKTAKKISEIRHQYLNSSLEARVGLGLIVFGLLCGFAISHIGTDIAVGLCGGGPTEVGIFLLLHRAYTNNRAKKSK